MNLNLFTIREPTLSFAPNSADASEFMPRDQEQSRRLHEPTHMDSSIDPITGNDIKNRATGPRHDDGSLTVYFETEGTQRTYLGTPFNHPFPRLPGKASAEDDRGG